MSMHHAPCTVQVAESVSELAGIFKEIQVLVIDQGTILDRIDFNIEMAADKVTAATVEIDKANQIQKKSRAMLCIYLLLLLCGAMVVAPAAPGMPPDGASQHVWHAVGGQRTRCRARPCINGLGHW